MNKKIAFSITLVFTLGMQVFDVIGMNEDCKSVNFLDQGMQKADSGNENEVDASSFADSDYKKLGYAYDADDEELGEAFGRSCSITPVISSPRNSQSAFSRKSQNSSRSDAYLYPILEYSDVATHENDRSTQVDSVMSNDSHITNRGESSVIFLRPVVAQIIKNERYLDIKKIAPNFSNVQGKHALEDDKELNKSNKK